MEQIAMTTTAITPYKSSNSGLVWQADKDQYIATRGFKTDALLQFLTFPDNCTRWVELDALVRVFDGRVSDSGRKAMRRRLTKAYHDFRDEKYQRQGARGGISLISRANTRNAGGKCALEWPAIAPGFVLRRRNGFRGTDYRLHVRQTRKTSAP